MTATLERRKEVLKLSREHDFMILEGPKILIQAEERTDVRSC